MKSGYGEPLRRLFSQEAWIESVVDFGHAKQIFADGVHAERNPSRHLAVLRDLIDLRAILHKGDAPASGLTVVEFIVIRTQTGFYIELRASDAKVISGQ